MHICHLELDSSFKLSPRIDSLCKLSLQGLTVNASYPKGLTVHTNCLLGLDSSCTLSHMV